MSRLPVCLLLLLAPLLSAAADRPPNVILIFTDDQAYADVGAFGAAVPTPALDSLARDGVKFTNFHVSQPVCSASRAALLTGCYSNRLGIHGALMPDSKHGLHPEETTLAELLRSRGYATGIVGKWHLGHQREFLPTAHGFDEYFGLPYSNDMWPYHPELPADRFPPLPLYENEQVIDAEVTPDDQRTLTTRYTERAVAFIERNRDRPFFFYLAHSQPHVPLFVSDKFQGRSGKGLYGDVLMELDWSVGEVLKALARHGLERDTLVIFTTDNGPWLSYGEHAGSAGAFREGKGTVWEGGVRVPCLMRWPGRLPAGVVTDDFVMTIDLLPTLARLAGATPGPRPVDGRDVWPLLARQPGATNPHSGYAYYYNKNELQAVVTGDGRWKLVLPHRYRTLAGGTGGKGGMPAKYSHRDVTAPELYDLKEDPAEKTDVAAKHPRQVEQLLALAETFRDDLGDSLVKRDGRNVREPGHLAAGP